MSRLNSYLELVAFALSTLTSASPLNYQRLSARQAATSVPNNVANGTITSECAQFHTVVASETCLTIEANFNISDLTFHTLNPEINMACTNLMEGLAYCVQMASAPTTTPVTSTTPPVTSTTTSPSTPTSVPPPSNVANGTITVGCTQFFIVPPGDSCPDVETKFNISDALFHALNTGINTLCSNLFAGEAYCVATSNSTTTNGTSPTSPPTNPAEGTITQGCTQFFTAQPGSTCPEIQAMFNITPQFFSALNPEINSQCSNLIAGEAYCVQSNNPSIVPIPPNVASGTTTAGCTGFFTVKSGNTCQTIEQMFDITFADFVALNPEINADCTNLLLGEAYCVQTSNA